MEIVEKFCENLRALRESLGFSADDFGKKLGITGKHIYDIEKGRKKPSFDLIVLISKTFDVPISDLFKDNLSSMVRFLPMSEMCKRVESIPDNIYDLALKVGKNDKIAWEDVQAVLESAIDRRETKKSKNKKA